MKIRNKLRTPSVVNKLNNAVVLMVLLFVIAFTVIAYIHQKNTLFEQRGTSLKSFGAIMVSTVKRPFSLGAFSEVQTLLDIEKFPKFVTSIKVLDVNKIERAVEERRIGHSCDKVNTSAFPIMDDGVQAGQVVISSGNCDLVNEFNNLMSIMFGLAVVIIGFGVWLGKRMVYWAWSPTKLLIERATNLDSFSKDLVNGAPREIQPLIQQLIKSYKNITVAELYDEMLHNLASPVKTLRQIYKKQSNGKNVTEKDFEVIGNCISHIESYLKAQQGPSNTYSNSSVTCLDDVVESVINGKMLEYSSKEKQVKIEFDVSESDYGAFSNIKFSQLRDILSNMINNSYDALKRQGNIKLKLTESKDFHTITLWDNGRGIKDDDLKVIFDREFSLKGSSGLGLHHAKKIIEKIGGSICVESKLNAWTEFKISLPKISRPSWFVSEVNLSDIDTVVVIDDDHINFTEWQGLLAGLGSIKAVRYIPDRQHLSDYLTKTGENLERTLFVVDYIFTGKPYKGIDLIREFELENCFISSNKLRGSEIYTACRSQGVKILPKHMVSRVPISFSPQICAENVDAVFLDDDKNTSYVAEDLKESYSISARVFNTPDDFFMGIESLPKDTFIFIDKDLGTTSGIEIAKELRSRGIDNIIASSGSTVDSYSETDKSLFKGFVHKLNDTQEYAAVISGEKVASW